MGPSAAEPGTDGAEQPSVFSSALLATLKQRTQAVALEYGGLAEPPSANPSGAGGTSSSLGDLPSLPQTSTPTAGTMGRAATVYDGASPRRDRDAGPRVLAPYERDT